MLCYNSVQIIDAWNTIFDISYRNNFGQIKEPDLKSAAPGEPAGAPGRDHGRAGGRAGGGQGPVEEGGQGAGQQVTLQSGIDQLATRC